MFILRSITKRGNESNITLGSKYSLITEADNNEDFKAIQSLTAGQSTNSEVYAYLEDENGSKIPLYKGQRNYIMTENGRTFSNLTNRQ